MEIGTLKVNVDGVKIENDISKGLLTITRKDSITQYNFCIVDVTGNIVTLKEVDMITQTGTDDPRIKDIIPVLCNPPKKETRKTKTSKTTIKGKKQKKELTSMLGEIEVEIQRENNNGQE